ncbi:membrane or secreted protein [Aporhodopirellula aestuarii]|uniref:Membrane or secreted protein n=1 Tax=Aporhodopirellula aestuarii TaxID=2950107 RepID=A0ABT0U7Z8_9BACT|nr:membrane or secreted protein [Aporhodopirellula aestuarii]MCM2373069.1 membrane or secreted protein [Aporhodopirellula aestuarii]
MIHRFQSNHLHLLFFSLFVVATVLGGRPQNAVANGYVSGLRLLPADAAGVAWVANMPVLAASWQETTLHELGEDDLMRPLIEANLGADGALWSNVGDKIGVRPKEFYEIASGEVVVAWLPFENDRRRPSCLCVVADIRGNHQQAISVVDRIDQDLKADGATRTDVEKFGETIRVYQPKTRPGQLKIEQVVIAVTEDRIIASNRDTVVIDMLEAIPNGGLAEPVEEAPLFKAVAEQVSDRIEVKKPGSTFQWYVRPLSMGRILRDVAKVDRGNKVKILNLLENQGFDAIEAMGGTVVVRQDEFDLLHRGYVHAPPVTDLPDRYRLAARVLQFPNGNLQELPGWIPKTTATVTQMNWKMEEAFWALESLVNEAFNDKIFRPTIAGIRDDEEGPQIDIEKNVMPNLGEHLLLLTDNTEPITVDSERLLVAIEVIDQDVIANAIAKAMEVEPDVQLVESVKGVDIWKVQRGEGEIEEEVFFDDFGGEDDMEEKQPPLLDTWAIAMVGKGPGSTTPYLMFSSHVDFLIEVAERIGSGAGDGLNEQDEIKELLKTTKEFGGEKPAIQRIVRLRESLQAKYELRRRGELKDSDSVLASVIRRLFEDDEQEEIERPNANKWPPYSQVKKFFKNASSFVETTDTGWSLNAFLLH